MNIHVEHIYSSKCIYIPQKHLTAAVAQSVRAFTSQAEGWVFESQPRKS